MKKTQFTEEQIAFALRQAVGGTPIEQITCKLGGQRSDVLPLEEEVCGDWSGGAASVEATRRRKPQTQIAGGRPELG